jgi:hypothetical protein
MVSCFWSVIDSEVKYFQDPNRCKSFIVIDLKTEQFYLTETRKLVLYIFTLIYACHKNKHTHILERIFLLTYLNFSQCKSHDHSRKCFNSRLCT